MRGYKLAEQQTLEELKAANAAEEENSETPETEEENFLEESGDEENSETPEVETPDDEEGEGTEEESEAFLQEDGDEQGDTEDDEKFFTSGDIAAAKRKLKGKLGEKDNEIEALRQEVNQLKQGVKGGVNPTEKPKRSDYLDADDPDEAYLDALHEWKSSFQQDNTERRQAALQAKKEIDANVDRHYKSAGDLIKKHGISPEVYQQADQSFRSSIEQVLPKKGDIIADFLIASLGEGSDKTVFHIGRNKAKLAEFQSKLLEDPSGVKAAMFIASVNSTLSSPKKYNTSTTGTS